jgi:hypothetical protein
MTLSALLLSSISFVLGLLPLLPSGSVVAVIVAALAVLPALSGLLLALASRSQALRSGLRLGLATGVLTLSVAATLLCTVWLFALVVAWRAPRGQSPRTPLPSPQTAQLDSSAMQPIRRSAHQHVVSLRGRDDFEYTGATFILG